MARRAPSSDPDLTELDLVQRLARQIRRADVDTGRWGLSPHQARALSALARRAPRGAAPTHREGDRPEGGLRVSELAGRLQIAPRSATEVADALQALGLVERRPDPSDRRAVLLAATGRGMRVADEIRRERREAASRVLDVLQPAERAELRRLLGVLLEEPAGGDSGAGVRP